MQRQVSRRRALACRDAGHSLQVKRAAHLICASLVGDDFQRTETDYDDNGIKTVVEYRMDDQGRRIKVCSVRNRKNQEEMDYADK